MTAVLQRVSSASVKVGGEVRGSCRRGFMILLGVAKDDGEEDCRLLADKIAKMRVFPDENDRMNLSVCDIDGSVLVIPNFTLLASYKKGNRPDFTESAPPDRAKELYEYFCSYLGEKVPALERGVFGAHMTLDPICDGPVTIVMDSRVLRKR